MGGYSPSSRDIDSYYRERDYYGARSYYDSGRREVVRYLKKIKCVMNLIHQRLNFQEKH